MVNSFGGAESDAFAVWYLRDKSRQTHRHALRRKGADQMGKKYPAELLKIVRATSKLSEIYWHPDCFPKEFEFAEKV